MKPYALAALFAGLFFFASCGPKDPLGNGTTTGCKDCDCKDSEFIGTWAKVGEEDWPFEYKENGDVFARTVTDSLYPDGIDHYDTVFAKVGTWKNSPYYVHLKETNQLAPGAPTCLIISTANNGSIFWDVATYVSADSIYMDGDSGPSPLRRVK